MALVFCDGFDHLATVDYDPYLGYSTDYQLWYKWEMAFNIGDMRIGHNPDWLRRPAKNDWPIGYVTQGSTYYQTQMFRHFNEPHYNTIIVGFAFMGVPGYSPPASPILTIYDYDENIIGGIKAIDENGRVRMIAGSFFSNMNMSASSGTIQDFYSDINVVEERTWYHLEAKWVFDEGTGGSMECRINETAVIDQTGIQTYKAGGDSEGNYSVTQIELAKGLHNRFYVDDLFVLDGEGSVANDFIGDCRVDTIYPNANGDYINFDPEPSSNDNYENVQPIVRHWYSYADHATLRGYSGNWYNTGIDFSTYNEAEDPVRECYHHESIPSLNKPIYGIQSNSVFRKTDAGRKQVEQFIRVSSTNYDSGRIIDVPDWSKVYYYPVTINPYTTAAWTESDINSLQSGIEIVT